MTKIKVLIVDDAVVVRKVLSDVLGAEPDMELVGTAANGRLGVQKVEQTKPDVVLLDIEMPEMDGIEALQAIRKIDRRLPVIMFSTLTERGAAATLDALANGASDYVTKPTNSGSITGARDQIKADLVPKIRQLCQRHMAHAAPAEAAPASSGRTVRERPFGGLPPQARQAPARPAAPASPLSGPVKLRGQQGPSARVDVLAIGVSTGGPNALAQLLPALPGSLGVPVLIVQHMPPTFTRLLAERLDRASSLTVVEAAAGMPLRPNHAYVAPGDFHMVVKRSGTDVVIELNQQPPENSCRPAVDPLFRAVAEVYGPNCLAVVLTGMGSDGLKGAEHIVQKGGRVLAQDEATSVVWGMPGYVARAGIADAVLPLGELAGEIFKKTSRGAVGAVAAAGGAR